MEIALNIALGIGLSAACGFRVFVPFLVASVAALTGYLPLSPDFEWIATIPAVIVFGTATFFEVLAYYIPWLDNALDTIATPFAVVAGTLIAASVVTELSPLLRWALALIAGGAAAGIVQGATALLRAKSTLTTAGMGNFVVATVELVGAFVTSLLSLLFPLLTLVLIVLLVYLTMRFAGRLLFGRNALTSSSNQKG